MPPPSSHGTETVDVIFFMAVYFHLAFFITVIVSDFSEVSLEVIWASTDPTFFL